MAIEILMPALSPTMEEGTLSRWLVKEGDEIKSGDVIAEIETDKATMEVEAVDEGRIGKILVEGGSEGVKVNAVIALLLEEGEDESALKEAQSSTSQKPPPDNEVKGKESKTSETPAERSESRGQEQDEDEVPDRAKRASGSSDKGRNGSSRLKASPLAKTHGRAGRTGLEHAGRLWPEWPHRQARCRSGAERRRAQGGDKKTLRQRRRVRPPRPSPARSVWKASIWKRAHTKSFRLMGCARPSRAA